MLFNYLIYIGIIWFLVSGSVFYRKCWRKFHKNISILNIVKFEYTIIQYTLFIKRDSELTPWIIQVWISFILFAISAFIISI